MRVALGSTNPAKIKAVDSAINKIWPNSEVIALNVQHGTNNQPRNDKEAIEGAIARAKLSLKQTDADMGLGLEGSIVDTEHGMFLSGWVAAIDKTGKVGLGCGGMILLPETLAKGVREGEELGTVVDTFFGEHGIKTRQGTIGILTNNLIPRHESFEKATIRALAKFMNPHFYEE